MQKYQQLCKCDQTYANVFKIMQNTKNLYEPRKQFYNF